jgi:hypothetical protein
MGAVMGIMSELDLYSQTIEAVRKEMAGEPAEVQLEYRLDCSELRSARSSLERSSSGRS